MEKKQNVPALRFQGFSGEWKRQKFGEVATFINGRAYAQSELLSAGKYKVLRVGNFYTNSTWYYSNLELSDKYYANRGDLLYTWSATFGPHIWDGDKVIYHYHIWKIEVKEQLEKLFFLQLLERDKKNLLNDTNGSTMVHITKLGMENKTDFIPNNIDEQSKIGQFCSQINCKIEKEKRKIQKLQQFRQAMLTKLFPREGAAEPELRFRGFSGKWKRCKLGDVATFINGRAYTRDELLSTGKYKVLRVGNFYTNDKWYYSNLELGEKYYAHKGDLLYTWSATFGPHIWDGDTVIYHYHIWKVELSEYLDKLFALQLLELDRDALLSDTNGSTMIHITMSDMKNRWITISENIEEQKLIGLFFYHLNLFISLQQKKLKRMQRLKAALLEKLFV